MTHYMDVHHGLKNITAEQLEAAHNADLAAERDEGVHFEHVWADPGSGIVYCLSDAPSADAVQRVHQKAGHPADEVHPVPLSA